MFRTREYNINLRRMIMNLQQALDDVESVCRTCEECEPSCANNVFRDCIQSEIEYDEIITAGSG
jgi:hypothetical protein